MKDKETHKDKSMTVTVRGEQEKPQAGSLLEKSSTSSQTNENDAIKTKSARKNRIGWSFWVATAMFIVVAVAVFHFSDRINPPSERGGRINPVVAKGVAPSANEVEALRKKRQFELEELKKKQFLADVELRVQKYKGDVAATVERYRKMLPLSEADAAFRRSEDGASFIASKEGLCGFKCCVSLAYKMAYDKAKGTTRTEDAISPVIKEKIVDEIKKAVVVYTRWTADFQKEIATEEAAFAADLAVKSKSFESTLTSFSEENAISLAVDTFVRDIQDHAYKAAGASASLVLEAAMIKTSYAAIKNVVVRLASVALSSAVKRAGTSLAASGTAVVVDGPLPFGDIIGAILTVGGLSWAAYDIYDVTKTMPDEMRTTIQQSISQTRMELEKSAIENLQKVKEECETSVEQKLSEINKILKGE